ncbi:MAG: DUF4352 domain-containing protein [Candidatus Bathyarchaeota archaeon]|nr:MAG: DUF4352 domain-containing protein [Candidatus Bathyarchaeota archaeon]
MRKIRSRKAVSPVIATVILVAVAITVAVAVAYWMGGISGQYTKFEKVEIKSAVCTVDANFNWIIAITLKNSGTATATLDAVYVNNDACSNGTAPGAAVDTISTDLSYSNAYQLTSGEEQSFSVWIGVNYLTLSSGTTVNIKIHSAGGMEYPKLVELI